MVIANKCDLDREASPDDVASCAREAGAIGSIETSAKNGDNVEEAFLQITRAAIGRILLGFN